MAKPMEKRKTHIVLLAITSFKPAIAARIKRINKRRNEPAVPISNMFPAMELPIFPENKAERTEAVGIKERAKIILFFGNWSSPVLKIFKRRIMAAMAAKTDITAILATKERTGMFGNAASGIRNTIKRKTTPNTVEKLPSLFSIFIELC
jgi:hypothetical protein